MAARPEGDISELPCDFEYDLFALLFGKIIARCFSNRVLIFHYDWLPGLTPPLLFDEEIGSRKRRAGKFGIQSNGFFVEKLHSSVL